MFKGFSEDTINFMWNIRFNNEKSWFEAHKEEYKTVLQRPMNLLASEVYEEFSKKHPDLKLNLHVSRIYRDARRLHGKGPYKDHLWFSIRSDSEEWIYLPTFWFELEPEKWSYGVGYYSAKAETMAKHRARIDKSPKQAEALVRALNGQSEFVLKGESYARPKGDPGKLLYDWYNMKDFCLIHEEGVSAALFSPDFAARIAGGFDFLSQFYSYFSSLASDA